MQPQRKLKSLSKDIETAIETDALIEDKKAEKQRQCERKAKDIILNHFIDRFHPHIRIAGILFFLILIGSYAAWTKYFFNVAGNIFLEWEFGATVFVSIAALFVAIIVTMVWWFFIGDSGFNLTDFNEDYLKGGYISFIVLVIALIISESSPGLDDSVSSMAFITESFIFGTVVSYTSAWIRFPVFLYSSVQENRILNSSAFDAYKNKVNEQVTNEYKAFLTSDKMLELNENFDNAMEKIDSNDILPDKFKEPGPVNVMLSYFEDRRADTIKEAINLYIQERNNYEHQEAVLSEQRRAAHAAERAAAAEEQIANAENERLNEQRKANTELQREASKMSDELRKIRYDNER